ncbi:MAG: FMN-binding glutamate synthase family protein [Pirellulaceae bacterium]|nr:FMN-binding glutamate synthase family protein [Pirellulaceae bacterium]HJN09258.1 FMN-binding glutamate synthase family protein [Pirellulaceae bacterium]
MWILIAVAVVLGSIVLYDITQRKRTILRNFPIVGHFRYWLESIGPELRQYIVTSNTEERPFSRAQRRWIYASSKKANQYFGFGTEADLERSPNHLVIKHASFPLSDPLVGQEDYDPEFQIQCAKIVGAYRNRRKAFRPQSVVNISGMSFGSLSGRSVEAFNRGASAAGCLHNTGEGGVSRHHLHGGDLVWQIGTGYFGCRDSSGGFDMARLLDVVAAHPIKAIEIKLSQGAKPGVGGFLPAAKITPEIAEARGIPLGKDCASPATHTAFTGVDSLLDFVEQLAEVLGLPVGIKSAIGQPDLWQRLTDRMAATGRGVDFITIDGAEGGTGAAPLVFSDHVALPLKVALSRVYREFAKHDLHESVVFNASGKLGFPESALFAFALGADMVSVAREAMLSIGCIQAQRCHTGHCPAGVATQNQWLMRGLDPTLKAARLANYVVALRKELLRLGRACGVSHPALIGIDHFEILNDRLGSTPASEIFGYPSDESMSRVDDTVAAGC